MTLRVKITVAVAFAVLATTVTISVIAYQAAYQSARQQFENAVGDNAEAGVLYAQTAVEKLPADRAIASIQAFLNAQNVGQDLSAVFISGSYSACAVGGRDDYPCVSTFPAGIRDSIYHGSASGGYVVLTNDSDNDPIYLLVNPLPRPHLPALELVQGAYFHKPDDLRRLEDRLIELNALALFLALLVGFGVATGIRRPIRRVSTAAQRFGEGDLDVRPLSRGHDELASLATNFNAMADRLSTTVRDLQESQSLQHRFVADVSHELRTPLSAMVAAGDGLDAADRAVRERSAGLLREQTRRMARMVDDLLEMSRFDAGQVALELETADVADLARDAARTIAPDAALCVDATGNTTASIDVRRVHAIIRNLIANAVHHGAPPVAVNLDGRGTDVVLTVTDHGLGVPPRIAGSVFDRFVRGDSARSTTMSSTGLGLAIARENALLHGGDLTLAPGSPTTFTLRLPRRRTPN